LNGKSENNMDNLGVFHSRRPPFVEVTKYRGCQWPVARYIKRFGVHPVHGGKLEVKDLVPLWGCRDWVPTGGSVRVQFLGKESMGIIYLMGIYIYIFNGDFILNVMGRISFVYESIDVAVSVGWNIQGG
jgi:hypothetical protein